MGRSEDTKITCGKFTIFTQLRPCEVISAARLALSHNGRGRRGAHQKSLLLECVINL